MTFSDLPSNWPHLPVDGERHIADLLDLFVSMRDRMEGSVLVLLCDEQGEPAQPVMIHDEGQQPAAHELRIALRRLADGLSTMDGVGSVLVARGRPGGKTPTVADTQFALGVLKAFDGRVAVRGVYLVTPRGSCRLDQGAPGVRSA